MRMALPLLSGAGIRIMKKHDKPACAAEGDELLCLTGSMEHCMIALRSILARLKANPPRERPGGPRPR